jgi:hypothetical protein
MTKDKLKQAIKELFDDEEFVSKFSKSFTSNIINHLLNDPQTQFKNILPKAASDKLNDTSI